MEIENEKKGVFKNLGKIKKTKKSSCCCNFEIEEIPPEEETVKNVSDSKEEN